MLDITEFDNGYGLSVMPHTRNRDEDFDNLKSTLLNVSLPVAIAVTAYARMYMSDFKMKYKDNLYYSDTDSLILDCALPKELVGNELGQFKLEYLVEKGVFLGPKLYGIQVLEDGLIKDIVKVKGYKVSFPKLLNLLTPDRELVLNQDKWFRSLSKGNISIIDTLYTIAVLENKRR
jgi:hypothetical protein